MSELNFSSRQDLQERLQLVSALVAGAASLASDLVPGRHVEAIQALLNEAERYADDAVRALSIAP